MGTHWMQLQVAFTRICEEENMEEPSLQGVAESLRVHDRPSQIAFTLYELLTEADYSDEEILAVAAALEDIIS